MKIIYSHVELTVLKPIDQNFMLPKHINKALIDDSIATNFGIRIQNTLQLHSKYIKSVNSKFQLDVESFDLKF